MKIPNASDETALDSIPEYDLVTKTSLWNFAMICNG